MQPDAQVLQVRFEPGKLACFTALDQALRHQVVPAVACPAGPCDPLDHVKIAQAAGRLFQIRLERIRRILVLRVALLLLQLLRLEERRGVQRALHLRRQLAVEASAAGQKARLEKRGAHRDVARRRLDAAFHGTYAVADLQTDVPEPADQSLQRLALGFGRVLGQQHEQIDVGGGIELAPAIAAGGDQRGVAHRGDLVPHLAHGAIDELAVLDKERARVRPAQIGLAQRLPAGSHFAAQVSGHGAA